MSSTPDQTYRVAAAPWCGFTKKLKDDLGIAEYDLAYEFDAGNGKSFYLTMVDCTKDDNKQDPVCKQSNGFPHIFRQDGNSWVTFNEGYAPDAYSKICDDVNNRPSAPVVDTNDDCGSGSGGGSSESSGSSGSSGKTYVIAGADWCGYTKKLKSQMGLEYNVTKDFGCPDSGSNFSVRMIDCAKDENKTSDACKKSRGFPHTFLETKGGKLVTAMNGFNPDATNILCKGDEGEFAKKDEWINEFNRRMEGRASDLQKEHRKLHSDMQSIQTQIKDIAKSVKEELKNEYNGYEPPM
tara:strand:- start:2837 stop:3721 length:885 start_codon:yes stop_codon:yes gene_type:complete